MKRIYQLRTRGYIDQMPPTNIGSDKVFVDFNSGMHYRRSITTSWGDFIRSEKVSLYKTLKNGKEYFLKQITAIGLGIDEMLIPKEEGLVLIEENNAVPTCEFI